MVRVNWFFGIREQRVKKPSTNIVPKIQYFCSWWFWGFGRLIKKLRD